MTLPDEPHLRAHTLRKAMLRPERYLAAALAEWPDADLAATIRGGSRHTHARPICERPQVRPGVALAVKEAERHPAPVCFVAAAGPARKAPIQDPSPLLAPQHFALLERQLRVSCPAPPAIFLHSHLTIGSRKGWATDTPRMAALVDGDATLLGRLLVAVGVQGQ